MDNHGDLKDLEIKIYRDALKKIMDKSEERFPRVVAKKALDDVSQFAYYI